MIHESDRRNLKTAKDDTNPFGRAAYKPHLKFQRWAIGLAMATIFFWGLLLIFRPFSPEQRTGLMPAAASKGLKPAITSSVFKDRLTAQLQVNEIIAMETVARQDKKILLEFFEQLPEKSSIAIHDWNFSNLTTGQIDKLRQKARSGDRHCVDFLVLYGKYKALKKRISELETRLGHAKLVVSGDTHFQIANNFLIAQAGKTDAEAHQILQNTQFQEPLLPGFKVWNFWLQDGFCTFVTQGNAPLTPREAARQEKETALLRLHSLFYIIGSTDDLQNRKILIGGFLKSTRMGEIASGQFRLSIDLRSQQRIRASASALQMKKISRLTIYPREFNAGRDYMVRLAPLGNWAQVTILKKEVFRGRRIVIAVE